MHYYLPLTCPTPVKHTKDFNGLEMAISWALLFPALAAAAVVRVVPTGGDPTQAGEVSSIAEALATTRRLGSGGHRHVIELKPGRHELSEPLLFEQEDSGLSFVGSGSTISGGKVVDGWAPCNSGAPLMCAPLTFDNATGLAQPRHLFVNGRRAPRGVASGTVTSAFAEPVSVDSEKYVVDATASGAGSWASGVEMVYTALGSPWTESRCTVDRVENVTRPSSSSDDVLHVYMKQPCFAAVQAKPCGQSTHV